jgi:hypothetical protein
MRWMNKGRPAKDHYSFSLRMPKKEGKKSLANEIK